ncbi:hypothetical protein AB0M28_15075 [Streptomyces sp. NPDC051940]|uniref:hypothetical protein n=1 Tax=Streptomyces sp. NPDC051940 TaxID=3155675 RepID=UPI00343DB935
MAEAWAEWEESKAGVRARAAETPTSLDGAGSDPMPGYGVQLVVTPQMLRSAADKAGEQAAVLHGFRSHFVPGISDAAAGMKGFGSATAFAVLEERWRDQTRRLVGLMTSDLGSSLRQSATLLARGDISAQGDLMRIASGAGGRGAVRTW